MRNGELLGVSLVVALALAIRSVNDDTLPTQESTTTAVQGFADCEAAFAADCIDCTISTPGFKRHAWAVNGPEHMLIDSLSDVEPVSSDFMINVV